MNTPAALIRKILISAVCGITLTVTCHAQKWVDTAYQIRIVRDVEYGIATDFAGNQRRLTMDIAYPTTDQPPRCGRPLLVAVHGGGFMAGDKSDPVPQAWMRDFAKRGYATATVNYRLGFFNTPQSVHCNVSDMFGVPWDCSNAADTAEWYRADYRAMQDVKGAIRFLITNRQLYNIDPNNVFLAGESGGGFVVLQAAYLDTIAEKPVFAGAMPPAAAPNIIYQAGCIQKFGWDTSVADMNLARPDLGGIQGDLYPAAPRYRIKGVGNIYGAMLGNLFALNTYGTPPPLYMFHQPNDLIVPFGTDRLFAGLGSFFAGAPFNCGWLINTPWLNGSSGIKRLLDSMKSAGYTTPAYITDFTSNTADGWQQVADNTLTGHSMQDYGGHTLIMARLFAAQIDTSACNTVTVIPAAARALGGLRVFPNPASSSLRLAFDPELRPQAIQLTGILGQSVLGVAWQAQQAGSATVQLPGGLPAGVYFLKVICGRTILVQRLVVGD